jgi:mannose-6-phosphate isomerase-like protein (cupin superfamily)
VNESVKTTFDARFMALIDALCRLCRDEYQSDPDAGLLLRQIATSLAKINAPERPITARQLPACRHLAACAAGTESVSEHVGTIISCFHALQEYFYWTQNPNYSDDRLGAGYMDNYAYCELVGARGRAGHENPGLIVGFLLLGPHLFYPDHHHPAAEIYYVLHGSAEWRRGGESWQRKPPGSLIFHPPWIRHATRCAQEPLLALYFWHGDVMPAADLV